MDRIAYERILNVLEAFELVVDKAIAEIEAIEAAECYQHELKAAA